MSDPTPSQDRLRPAVLMALVATLAAAAFAPALAGGFIYDDHHLIANNGLIRSFDHWRYWLTHDFWDLGADRVQFGDSVRYWRPAITASYALDWQLGGGSPVVFHLTNLVWHATAAVLTFRALLRWSGVVWPAALGTLFFALHPTKAESVAWISGRTDVLCLVALLVVCELDVRRRADPARRWQWAGLEAAATVLAYMLKEHAVVIPALLAIEAWAERTGGVIDRQTVNAAVRRALPQLCVAIGYLGVRSHVWPPRTALDLALVDRAALLLESAGRYAVLILAPHDLSVQQALLWTHHGRISFDWRYVVCGVGFILVLAAVAWLTRRQCPGVTVGIVAFAALQLPTSNLIPVGIHTMVAERFLYIPLLGLALALACALTGLPVRRRNFGAGATLAVIALFTAQSARRANDFSDEDRFWSREIALHPESFDAMRYFIGRDVRARELRAALRWVGRAMALSNARYRHLGLEVEFGVQGAHILLMLTPDRSSEELGSLDAFFARLERGREGAVRLESPELAITFPLSPSANQKKLDSMQPRLLAFRAEIASRRAEDEKAVALSRSAVAQCAGCAEVAKFAAVACARASRYDEGDAMLDAVARRSSEVEIEKTRQMLARGLALARQAAAAPDGPLRLQLRAQELSVLEAWGRAYAVLSPHKESIKHAPGMALGFAELAFRAGDAAVANEVLSVVAPPEQHAALRREWARKMGWQETSVP